MEKEVALVVDGVAETSASSGCTDCCPDDSATENSSRCCGESRHSRLDFRDDVLYGRDEEVRALLRAYRRAAVAPAAADADTCAELEEEKREESGDCVLEPAHDPPPTSSVVLVSGYSGVGKSALSRRLRRPVERSGGQFLVGKFDQLQADGGGGGDPYSAVASAFDGVFASILDDGSPEDVARMKDRITSALGTEAGLLTEILPSLVHIIGEQPAKTAVSGAEAQNRLNFAFRALARSVCSPEAPAVVVLDDVQWADEPSLDLIQTLVVEEDGAADDGNILSSSLLFVLCYRDNEVDMSHPFSFLLSDLRSAGVGLTEIRLENLSREDTNRLISDASHMSPDTSRPLTNIVYRKTQGNCFFVVQFLKSLCRDKLLYRVTPVDDDKNEEGGEWEWRWDEAAISSKDVSDDVVDLLAGRIRKLTPGVYDVLQVAACIGSLFDAATLQLVFDSSGEKRKSTTGSYAFASLRPRDNRSKSTDEDSEGSKNDLLRTLDIAVEEGLIDVVLPQVRFRFCHDKIQQATYSLNSRRAAMHYSIGDIIVRKAEKSELERMLFVAADQLNRGKKQITRKAKRMEVARINLRAGKKAMSSAAFAPAAKYLRTGIGLLGATKWRDDFELCLRLHNAAAEVEYINGNFAGAEEMLAEILSNARSLDEKLPAHLVHIESLVARMNFHQAIDEGLKLLTELGEKFPDRPGKASTLSAIVKTKYMLRDKCCKDLAVLPSMEKESATAAMMVMDAIITAAFWSKPKLLALLALRMVQLSVRHGLHRTSAVGFATYGMLLCGLGDVRRGNDFGNLALSIIVRFRANELLAQVYVIVYTFCKHWQNHMRQNIEPLLHGYRAGMQVGDVQFGLLCVQQYCCAALHSGKSLVSLETEMLTFTQQMKHHKQEILHCVTSIFIQFVQNMLGRSESPTELTGETMNEDDFLMRFSTDKDNQLLVCIMFVHKMKLAYYFGDIELAAKMAKRSRRIASLSPATFQVCDHAFFEALISCEMARRCSANMRWKRIAKKRLKYLKKVGLRASVNCRQKVLLVEAELFALRKHCDKASKAFEEAIATAGENGFVNDEAMAHERASIFFEDTGDHFKSSHHYVRAYNCYLKWGAEGKAEQLYKVRTRNEGASTCM